MLKAPRATSSLLVAALLLATACLVGCGPAPLPAVNLDPRRVDRWQGGMFGRLAVTNEGETVTEDCYAFFTDARHEYKTHLDLDASGWVFAHVGTGKTYLAEVRCVVGGLVKHVAEYRTRSIHFDVPGNGQVTYFGHVSIELDTSDTPAVVGAAVGGLLGAAISDIDAVGSDQALSVENRIGEATRKLKYQFGARADRLKVIDSLGGPSDLSKPAAPRNRDLIVTHAELGGLKLMWLGQPRKDARKIGLRFRRYAAKAELESCKELELTIDGVSARYPLAYKATRSTTALDEAVQAVAELDTVKAMVAARAVEFDLCGLKRKLSPQAADQGVTFLAAFEKRIPPKDAAAPLPAPAEPSGAPDAGSAHAAQAPHGATPSNDEAH